MAQRRVLRAAAAGKERSRVGVRLRARENDPRRGKRFVCCRSSYEYTRECLAIDVARRLNSENVLERLAELFVSRGVPDHIRSDNGPEFTAQVVREWLGRIGVKTLFIEPGSPWENGYVESFNGKLRDELLNGEIFYTLKEAEVLIERWRKQYNRVQPIARWAIGHPHPKRCCCSRLRSAPPAPTTSCQHRFNELTSGPNTWGRSSSLRLLARHFQPFTSP